MGFFIVINYFFLVKKYGFFGILKTLKDLIFTKFILPKSKIIRSPLYIRNMGSIIGGKNLISGPGLIIDVLNSSARLFLGNNICMNHRVHIGVLNMVTIGDNVLMASNVYISDHTHGNYSNESQSSPITPPNDRVLLSLPIYIGDNCWLGEGVCVLPGVSIGSGSIIGALSVVNRDIPSNSIAVGAPARVIKVWDRTAMKWVPIND